MSCSPFDLKDYFFGELSSGGKFFRTWVSSGSINVNMPVRKSGTDRTFCTYLLGIG